MTTAPHIYRLTHEDTQAYLTATWHRADIELEVCNDLIRQQYFDLAEVVTTTGQTAFYCLHGKVLDL